MAQLPEGRHILGLKPLPSSPQAGRKQARAVRLQRLWAEPVSCGRLARAMPMPTLLLQQPQLLQSLPPVPVGNALWGYLNTDTGRARKPVMTLSFEGRLLGGAPVLLQANQLAPLDSCKILPHAQGGSPGPGIPKDTG